MDKYLWNGLSAPRMASFPFPLAFRLISIMRPPSPIILSFLYVARYSLPVSANYLFQLPATVTVGVPVEANCKPLTPDDLNLGFFLAQARPGQENDIQGYTTDFRNPLKPDPSTGATRFVVHSPGTYVIKVWANISDPALGHPVDNSVAFAAALASTSSASLSTSSSPSTPNNGTVPESSSTSPNNNNTTPPSNSKTIIVVGVVGGVAFCTLILLGFWLWRRWRHRKRKQEEGLIKVRDPFNVQDSTSTSALHGPQKKHWTTNANGRQFKSVSTTQRQDLRRERDALQAELQRINSEIRRQDGNRNDSGQLQDDTEPRMRDCLHRIQARMDILTSEMAQMNRLMVPPSYVRDEGPETRGHGTTGMQISSSHKPRKHL